MKKITFYFLLSLCSFVVSAQNKFFTKQGTAHFDATAKSSLEQIAATNQAVVAILDIASGSVQFSIMIKNFSFKKSFMEEHFNEDYLESDKFPRSMFKGTITNNAEVNYAKDGSYAVKVKGNLMLHGVNKDIEAAGSVIIKNGLPELISKFSIELSDFKVSIPKLVTDQVSDTAKIDIDCKLELLNKKLD